jgi:hypothetical protein
MLEFAKTPTPSSGDEYDVHFLIAIFRALRDCPPAEKAATVEAVCAEWDVSPSQFVTDVVAARERFGV